MAVSLALLQIFIDWLACILCASPEIKGRKKKKRDAEEAAVATGNQNGRIESHRESRRKKALNIAEKWKTVAVVLDRIFFSIFLFALTFCFITIFPQPLKLFYL